MRPLSTQILRNALFGGGARLVSLAVAFPMTAYLVARLGIERFGLWAMVSVLTGAVGILDLSLRTAFVRHLAEDMARNDRDSVNEVVSAGFFFYLAFGVVVAAAAAASSRLLLEVFRVPAVLRREAVAVLFLGLARFLAGQLLSVYAALCDARQRMDVTNTLGLVALGVSTVLTLVLVESGAGLVGLGAAQLAGALLFYGACVPVSRLLAGPVRVSVRCLTRRTIKRLFGYSVRLHVSSICGMVNSQLDKFLLVRWTGLTFVGSYELGARLAANAGSLHPYLAAGLLPASSHLAATGNMASLRRIYRTASRYLFLVGMPLFAFLAAYAPDLMTAWLGRPDPRAARVLLILAAGFLVNTLSNGMAFICQGIGEAGLQMRQSALQMTVNIALSIALLCAIGPYGAALGTTLALVAGAAYFVAVFHRRLGVDTVAYLRATVPVPLLVSLTAAPGLVTMLVPAATRIEAVTRALAGAGIVGLAIVLAGLRMDPGAWRRAAGALRGAARRDP
jgi:O-antigen/teichoic acid export membrane protein